MQPDRHHGLLWLMQTHGDWRIPNRGVNGERTDEIRARFARDVLAAVPDASSSSPA